MLNSEQYCPHTKTRSLEQGEGVKIVMDDYSKGRLVKKSLNLLWLSDKDLWDERRLTHRS